jgi:hypothetical protein
MLNRLLFSFGMVTALLSGCAGEMQSPGDVASSSEALAPLTCPDPTDCALTNGTGIYYREGATAGMSARTWLPAPTIQTTLITHFINTGSKVLVGGYYNRIAGGSWAPTGSQAAVATADYQGKSYQVRALSEKGTFPTWTLFDPSTNQIVQVGGGEMVGALTLHLENLPTAGEMLTFASQDLDANGSKEVFKYDMQWRLNANDAGISYCSMVNGKPDEVVFQQGIYVDPVTGAVTRDETTAGFVTLSCRNGAPATAYYWGYDYLGEGADKYFDAAIQMKRASYCADEHYYTKNGTYIMIDDSAGILQESKSQVEVLESYWTPKGATCLDARRHPEMGFDGTCNGVKLPKCPTNPPETGAWLRDGLLVKLF